MLAGPHSQQPSADLIKDEILDRLASTANVAQFVSFGPGSQLEQRYCRILGYPPNYRFRSPAAAIAALFVKSPEDQVNIRTYEPNAPKGRDFLQQLRVQKEVLEAVQRYARKGLFTIVNETVNVRDGGVSGVAESGVLEFAPGTTPRGVDRSETSVASMPRELALDILTTVYGFRPAVDFDRTYRVEFSTHPLPRGYSQEHTILWELTKTDADLPTPHISWPNDFSEILGDKAFGLLVADALGFPVPKTIGIPRKLAPFVFGRPTDSHETWLRTCPRRPAPGVFTTSRGWSDPYALLAREDEHGDQIASVLAQQGVAARYSGALLTTADGEVTIEGVPEWGDRLMLGPMDPQTIPSTVEAAVREVQSRLFRALGPVTVEWVFDGKIVWVVQLRCEASESAGQVIVPGEIVRPHRFPKEHGVENLYPLIDKVQGTGEGIVVLGPPALTGHISEALRKAGIPSRFEPRPQTSKKDL